MKHSTYDTGSLTRAQVADLIKAGRNPSNGKRARKSPPTELELVAKKANWTKLCVVGAAVALRKATRESRLNIEQYCSMMECITKMENLLLFQVDKDFRETRDMIKRDPAK